jgi:hypothetical protein
MSAERMSISDAWAELVLIPWLPRGLSSHAPSQGGAP